MKYIEIWVRKILFEKSYIYSRTRRPSREKPNSFGTIKPEPKGKFYIFENLWTVDTVYFVQNLYFQKNVHNAHILLKEFIYFSNGNG